MARISKKMALYEVIGKSRYKESQKKILEQIKPKVEEKPKIQSVEVQQPEVKSEEKAKIQNVEVPKPEVKPEVKREEKAKIPSVAVPQVEVKKEEKTRVATPVIQHIELKRPELKKEEKPLWPRKPKMAQLNSGRVELAIPYHLAITLTLVLVVLILGVFHAGRFYQRKITVLPNEKIVVLPAAGQINKEVSRTNREYAAPLPAVEKKETPAEEPVIQNSGSNVIVIVEYQRKADLEPVKEFFDGRGIATEIRLIGDNYFLTTKQKFDNPAKEGTEGYKVLQLIKKYGAQYKAPVGSESFGVKPFQDAYGRKLDN